MSHQAATLNSSPATRRKLFRDIGTTFMTQVAMVPLALASGIILARALQPAAKGVYTTATTTATIVLMLGSLGVNKAMTYRLAKAGTTDPATVHRTGFLVSLVNGVFVTAVMVVLAIAVGDRLFAGVPTGVLIAAAPICLLTLVRGAWEGALRGEQRNQAVNGMSLVQSATFVAAVSCIALIWHLSAESAVALRVGALAASAAFALWQLGLGKALTRGRFDRRIALSLVAFGVPYAVVTMAQNISYRFDILLVQGFEGSSAAGIYSITTALTEMMWYLPLAVGYVVFPRAAASRREDAAGEAAALSRWTLAAIIGAVAVVAVITRPLITTMFGEAYAPAVDSTRLILLGTVTNVWYLILGSYLIGQGRLRAVALTTVLGVVVNLGCNLVLIPSFGIEGAAVSSSISYTLTGLLVLVVFVRQSEIPLKSVLVPTPREVRSRVAALRRRGS